MSELSLSRRELCAVTKQSVEARRRFVLSALRRARVLRRLEVVAIDTVGVALKGNLIDPDTAVEWLAEADLGHVLDEIGQQEATS